MRHRNALPSDGVGWVGKMALARSGARLRGGLGIMKEGDVFCGACSITGGGPCMGGSGGEEETAPAAGGGCAAALNLAGPGRRG